MNRFGWFIYLAELVFADSIDWIWLSYIERDAQYFFYKIQKRVRENNEIRFFPDRIKIEFHTTTKSSTVAV